MPRRPAPYQPRVKREHPNRLLDRHEAAQLVGCPVGKWSGYWRNWPSLVAGHRVVRTGGPGARGNGKWLLHSVEDHIEFELLEGALS